MTPIVAPMAGWLTSLDEVPDPVFAERMMGEGFAIDPTEGLVTAPCAGRIAAVAATGHSVTIAAEGGGTILIHVGLETVALGGAGFEPLVAEGTRVAAGTPLLRFDMDRVARGARSLLTPVVAIGEGDRLVIGSVGRLVSHGDRVGEIEGGTVVATHAADEVERTVTVPMAHGIHARPAARIAAALKPYAAAVSLHLDGRVANARSTIALMTLAAKQGSVLTVAGSGPDAATAVDALVALIDSGMGETQAAPLADAPPPGSPPPVAQGSSLAGIRAAPGLAIGTAVHLRPAEIAVAQDGAGIAAEGAALRQAIDAVRANVSAAGGAVAAAHLAVLDDPELLSAAEAQIAAGRSAGWSWRVATRAAADALRGTGDALLAERAADLADLEAQVLQRLTGAEPMAVTLPPATILLADELLPSQFLALDRDRLAGICTAGGGPTSHVAILAASAGVPMLVAVGAALHRVPEGQALVLDADAARLETDPGVALLADTETRLAARRGDRAALIAASAEEARTADGIRIEVFANLGSVADAAPAVAAGAEGCGLLRTEFLFLDRETAPDEASQARDYAAIAASLGDRPLIVRTLDIGGDKPVPYLPIAPEENPALGLRGVRLSLVRPDLLATQLRAVLRAVPATQLRIMVPMVIEVAELRAVRRALDLARAELGVAAHVPLGVMIETPAAALLAGSIAQEADFLSIGSNDLTQYALACDRGNPATAARVDPLHPAVLRLIALAAEGAAAHGRWVGVCGGIASDPSAAALLIGLGVTELSAAAAAIPAVKAAVRGVRMADARALAARALGCEDAAGVRALIDEAGSGAPV